MKINTLKMNIQEMITNRDVFNALVLICIFFVSNVAFALDPDEILIITNDKNPASLKIAEHYCLRRNVPKENILQLSLDAPLDDTISRDKYYQQIAEPIRQKLSQSPFDKNIKCLLTTYGVPYRVAGRGLVPGTEKTLDALKKISDDRAQIIRGTLVQLSKLGSDTSESSFNIDENTSSEKLIQIARKQIDTSLANIQRLLDADQRRKQLELYVDYATQLFGTGAVINKAKQNVAIPVELSYQEQLDYSNAVQKFNRAQKEYATPIERLEDDFYDLAKEAIGFCGSLDRITQDINILNGKETSAAVDSELSMLKYDDYELYRFQPNELKERTFWFGVKTLMVSRIDGPSETIAMNLIDKAVAAENISLGGNAYFDSGKSGDGEYKRYNEYIQKAAEYFRKNTNLTVTEETSSGLFGVAECPAAAIYCGWYSLENYIDSFEFVNGAIGYHIASFEAVDFRNPESSQWVPSMLVKGITATIGPVDEPYLGAFPQPDEFFIQIVKGKQLVEAYYRTKAYNSWQMMLIGDPLYCPKIERD